MKKKVSSFHFSCICEKKLYICEGVKRKVLRRNELFYKGKANYLLIDLKDDSIIYLFYRHGNFRMKIGNFNLNSFFFHST